jgi:hypothetical protein
MIVCLDPNGRLNKALDALASVRNPVTRIGRYRAHRSTADLMIALGHARRFGPVIVEKNHYTASVGILIGNCERGISWNR